MSSKSSNMCGRGSALACVLCVTALLAGGCSSVSNLLGTSSSTPASSSSSTASTPLATTAAGAEPAPGTSDYECPSVTIRSGTATLTVGENASAEPSSPLALKYQGTIVQTARECQFRGGTVTMKVGIEGRIITGPAGGAGQFDVPLRIAVVREGPEPKTVVSKLARVPVAVPDATSGVTFTHIDPEVVFPMPVPAAEIDNYIVYVGFDPAGIPPQKKKPAAKPRRNTAR